MLRLSFETRKFVSDKKDSLVGSSDELKFLQLSRSCSRVSVLQVEEHNEMNRLQMLQNRQNMLSFSSPMHGN